MKKTQTWRAVSAEEARRQAHLRLGNPRTVREREWRYRSFPWMEELWRDLRFAMRSLGKTPAFAIIAVVVIAVGIGVNTAVFSVIDAVLLKPLTYPNPAETGRADQYQPRGIIPGRQHSRFQSLAQQTRIFQQVAAYDFGGAGLNITGGDHPQQVQGIHVSAEYFAMFGAPVIAGRTFTARKTARMAVMSRC